MNENMSLVLAVPQHLNPAGVSIRMAGTADEPMWCLADVCQVLGHSNPSVAAKLLDEDEKNTLNFSQGTRGNPNMTFITEGGLYTLVFHSSVPAAKPFRKWVTSEVLPSIRKHGCYPPPAAKQVPYKPWSDRLEKSYMRHYHFVNQRRPGAFSALIAINTLMMAVEDELLRHCLPVELGDRPDGSVGGCWSHYRKLQGLPEVTWEAPLYMPKEGITVHVKVYGLEEFGMFQEWLYREYLPVKFPKYLHDKYAADYGVLPPASASDQVALDFTGNHACLPTKKVCKLLDEAGGFVSANGDHLLR